MGDRLLYAIEEEDPPKRRFRCVDCGKELKPSDVVFSFCDNADCDKYLLLQVQFLEYEGPEFTKKGSV